MRIIITLAFFSLTTSSLFAQSRFSFGLNAQLGLSGKANVKESQDFFSGSLYQEDLSNPLVPAAGIGGWVEYQSTEKVSFRSGLQYVNTGNIDLRETSNQVLSTGQFTSQSSFQYHFRVHQLQLPLELQIGLGQSQGVKPFLTFGAQLTRDWVRNIYTESDYMFGIESYASRSVWLPEYRLDQNTNTLGIQAVLGFGVKLNDNMSVRLRHTWQSEERAVEWTEDYSQWEIHTNDPDVIWCGVIGSYSAETMHRRLTSLEFSYRLY